VGEIQDARANIQILNTNSTSTSVIPTPQAEVSMLENVRPLANELTLQNTIVKSQLGSPSWHAEIGQKIVVMIGGADQSATLTLNPPNLGPLKVIVQVHNNDVNTAFISNNPEVRQALQDGLDHLRQSMAQSGISLGQTHVGSGNEQSQTALWQQQFSNTSNGGFSGQWGPGGGRNQGANAPIQAENGLAGRGVKASPSQDGLVNTFA
jgi:flagellar hook-length control protein FliK